MDWQMIGAVAAVVVPVGGLIVGLVVMLVNRQIDLVNRQFDHKFESVNRQFDAVNEKFDAVNRQFDTVNRQFDAVNEKFDRQFDVLRAENRAAHAQIGANVAGVRATLDALLLKLVPAGSPAAGRREGEARR